jgi:lipid A ethanolaminephosphotransferase
VTVARLPAFRVSHAAFCVAFPALLFAACNSLNIGKLSKWFAGTGGTDYVALSAYLLASLCLFVAFFVLLAHRRTVKPLAILLVATSAAATYFIAKYDVAIDSSMLLNVIHTDSTEVGQLLSEQMLPYILFLIVLPALVILAADITFRPSGRYLIGSAIVFTTALAVAIASLYLSYNPILRAGNVSRKYIVYSLVPVNFLSGGINAAYKAIKPWFAKDPSRIEIPGRVAAPGNLVVVLAIGESSRSRNFSLYGYDRFNTNPELEKAGELHVLNGIARARLDARRAPRDPREVGHQAAAGRLEARRPDRLLRQLHALRQLRIGGRGEGQRLRARWQVLRRGRHSRCSSRTSAGMPPATGSWSFTSAVAATGPVYSDRYPPEFQRLKPMCDDADVANECTRDELYNSYDNSILYVDHVVAGILRTLDRSRAPYVFHLSFGPRRIADG